MTGWCILYPTAYETTPTPASNCSRGGTLPWLPSPDDDDDDDDDNAMSSSSPAPVLEGARNGGSPQMQELLHDGRQRVNPYPPDPQLMTRRGS
jgi:hypothetical protein